MLYTVGTFELEGGIFLPLCTISTLHINTINVFYSLNVDHFLNGGLRGESVEELSPCESDVGHREQQCRRHRFISVSVDYRCGC